MSRFIVILAALTVPAGSISCSSKPTPHEIYEIRSKERRELLEQVRMNRELRNSNRQLIYDAMYY